MKLLKRLFNYIFWSLIALLSSFIYMRIVLGPKPKPSKGFMKIFDGIHDLVLLYVGSIIGAIVAVLYILFDIFYLKKKLENNSRPRLIRFITIIIITTIVGVTHYILEKVVDII